MSPDLLPFIRLSGALLLLGAAAAACLRGCPPVRFHPLAIALAALGWALLLAADAVGATVAAMEIAQGQAAPRAGAAELVWHAANLFVIAGAPAVILMMENRLDPKAPGRWGFPSPSALNPRGRRYRALARGLIGSGLLLWGVHLVLRLGAG